MVKITAILSYFTCCLFTILCISWHTDFLEITLTWYDKFCDRDPPPPDLKSTCSRLAFIFQYRNSVTEACNTFSMMFQCPGREFKIIVYLSDFVSATRGIFWPYFFLCRSLISEGRWKVKFGSLASILPLPNTALDSKVFLDPDCLPLLCTAHLTTS